MHLYHHRRILLEIQTPPPPPPRQHGSRATNFTSDANFDTNMVIILAALLCSLICAVGLNSIMRCLMRCTRQVRLDAADESSVASNGLKKSMMSQIPVAEYGAGMNIPTTECPICLGEFLDGEKVRVLPKCRHGFHVRCIDIWLACHSSCPTCRQSLLEQPPAAATNAAVDGEMLGSVEE